MSSRIKIEKGWFQALESEWDAPYFASLVSFVRNAYRQGAVYPPPAKIFAAFDSCPFDDVKVIILGQDPYHGAGQANGLCFSVNEGQGQPPSLVNIFKEMAADTGGTIPQSGNLLYLAEQGVLLLNTSLTVAEHKPGSHRGKGWEQFTDSAIKALSDGHDNLVFMLWGSNAISKTGLIDSTRHLILTSPHPSPLSAYRGFFGNKHFSKANAYLQQHGRTPIKWLL